MAATGLAGYIKLPGDFMKRGSIEEWVDAAAVALAASMRSAERLSYLSAPMESSGPGKMKNAPALFVEYRTEEELLKSLGPTRIMGYDTEVVRFRGGKSCVFKIALAQWGSEVERIKLAFAEQAKVKLDAWGWRVMLGMKTHLVVKSELPPGRNVDSVEIGGWRLKCERAEEQKCCCCGEAHDCFSLKVSCNRFVREG